jgi:hypothetical protein
MTAGETSQEMQLIASLIQAAAAIVFMLTVVYNAWRSYRVTEQARRDDIIRMLLAAWNMYPPEGRTPEEAQGIPFSPRQITHFNTRLKAMGETWTFPFRRVSWW